MIAAVAGCALLLLSTALLLWSVSVLGRLLALHRAEVAAQLVADERAWSMEHLRAVAAGDTDAEGRAAVVLCGIAKQRMEADKWVPT